MSNNDVRVLSGESILSTAFSTLCFLIVFTAFGFGVLFFYNLNNDVKVLKSMKQPVVNALNGLNANYVQLDARVKAIESRPVVKK